MCHRADRSKTMVLRIGGAALSALLLLAGCGGGTRSASVNPEATGTVAFTLEWESPPDPFPSGAVRAPIRPMAPDIDVCTDYGIETVTVKILSGTDLLASAGFPCSQHQGVINNVPAGDNLVLRIEGDVQGEGTVFAGDNVFSLAAGESKTVGPILMSYIGSDVTAPSVVAVFPDNNAIDVEYEPTLSVRFSERMAVNTVIDNEAFAVQDNTGTPLAGSISYTSSDNTVRFVPQSPLASGETHTVTLAPTMTDMSQISLSGAPFQWSFRVHERGTWSIPVSIAASPDFAAFASPQDDHVSLAGDGNGDAFALWTQVNIFEDGIREVWAQRFSGGENAWKDAVRISSATRNASSPQVSSGAGGRVAAVFAVENGGTLIRRYDSATASWGSAEIVSDSAVTSSPGIAMDATGTAHLVWVEPGGFFPPDLCSRRAFPEGGVTPPRGLASCIGLSSGGSTLSDPKIVSDPAGNATAVWREEDRIRGRRFSAAAGQWDALDNVLSSPLRSIRPDLAINSDGDLFAVWVEIAADNTSWQIHSRNYPAGGTGWSAPVQLASGGRDPFFPLDPTPRVAVGGTGTAFVVWHQNDPSEIFARRFESDTWLAAETISVIPPGLPFTPSYANPEVAADPSGNAFVSWSTDSCPSSEVWGVRYSASGGWDTAVRLRQTVCNSRVNVATTRSEDAFAVFWSTTIGGEGGLHVLYSSRNF